MKKYLIIFVLFTLLGAIFGFFYVNESKNEDKPTTQTNHIERIIDETSVPPIDPETNTDASPAKFDIANASRFLIKGEKENYIVLIPNGCTSDTQTIKCKNSIEFSIKQIIDPTTFTKPYKDSQSFPAGNYTITIDIKEAETLITILGKDTIYLLVTGANYSEISNQIFEVISTFSLENPAL